ncbi:MAG: FAD:protein FMN transferase [Dysgonamonadaceae bacterium]|nr:FAD:protein FMN transferase [Dysgonamonadaceae bacterium]
MTLNKLHCTSILVSVLIVMSCGQNKNDSKHYNYFLNQGEIFHTSFHIKYAYHRSLEKEILEELDKFDRSLNPFKENAIISKVNNNQPVETDSFFVTVFNKSMEVSRKSKGKFDITVSPLINAWGFGFKNMDSITPEIIDSLKQFVGYEKISIGENGEIVKADPRVQINTSAIAKGYSCDVVANVLKRHGIKNYMVEIGGEIAAKGVNDKGECWHIGIDKPVDDQTGMVHELQTILSICDKCMASSGNYRNFYVKNGKKYAHTIDPQTGYPSEQNILGATVIADDCMTADAYATTFMALGLEKSEELAKHIPGLYYYFIYKKPDETLAVVCSEGFEQFFN